MTESEFADKLASLLAYGDEDVLAQLADTVAGADTFESAGVLSSNQGLVVRFADGSEYQLTVVRSR